MQDKKVILDMKWPDVDPRERGGTQMMRSACMSLRLGLLAGFSF